MTSQSDSKPPSSALTFNLSEYDLGNTPIVPDPPDASPLSFTTATERSFTDAPKLTTLTTTSSDPETKPIVGVLDWKKKTMEINGRTRLVADLKSKTSGSAFNLTREWTWGTSKYVVSTKKGVWTAKRGEDSIAVLTPLIRHPFKKDELRTLTFHVNLSEEEMIFLILALIYQDLKLPPDQKPVSFKSAAGDAAVNTTATVAGNVATAGLTSCCSIQ
ncbi:hypothetical protein NLJ89_g7186 [Agrocybe chaxingu]|uniref:Uncharacterized protein n=1 Tax=Agrocybe chaxingu TaxID=84603 RepID=A0A9W8JXN4_9AGAR|nr:hypothetical protein NLJ89_g7186 [Agrocybe chaxingu]